MAVPRIQSITFGDRIEVSYIEERDVYSDGGFMARFLVIPPRAVDESLLTETMEAIQALIDDYLVRTAAPEPRIDRRADPKLGAGTERAWL